MVVDRTIPTQPGTCTYIAEFAWNWVTVGQQIADSVVNWATAKHGGNVNLVHISGIASASPTIDVETGETQIFGAHPGIKVIATCDGQYQRDGGRTCMEDLLQRFPAGQIDGVLTDNDDMGLGALDAIQAAGRTELVGPIWAHDATLPFLQEIIDGTTYMSVRRPIGAGQQIINTFQAYKAGQKVTPITFVPTTPYEASTPAGKAAVLARIQDLIKLGLTDN
jgi:ABC-type sugar transport system substrate-binding protein